MSFLSSLFGDDENAQRAADADAQLRDMNQAAIDSGRYDQAAADRIAANYATQATFGVEAQNKEIDAAFNEGLQDGANNITGFVSGAFRFVGKALAAVLLGIPIWVWLGVGAVAFFYLGGGVWLRGQMKKR